MDMCTQKITRSSIDIGVLKLLIKGLLSGASFQMIPADIEAIISSHCEALGREMTTLESREVAESLGCYFARGRIILNLATGLRLSADLAGVGHVRTYGKGIRLKNLRNLRLGILTFNIGISILCLAATQRSNVVNVRIGDLLAMVGYHRPKTFAYYEAKSALTCLNLVHFAGPTFQEFIGTGAMKSAPLIKNLFRKGNILTVQITSVFVENVFKTPDGKHSSSLQAAESKRRPKILLPTSLIGISRSWSRISVALAYFIVTERGNSKLRQQGVKVIAHRMSRLLVEGQVHNKRPDRAAAALMAALEQLTATGVILSASFASRERDPVMHIAVKVDDSESTVSDPQNYGATSKKYGSESRKYGLASKPSRIHLLKQDVTSTSFSSITTTSASPSGGRQQPFRRRKNDI